MISPGANSGFTRWEVSTFDHHLDTQTYTAVSWRQFCFFFHYWPLVNLLTIIVIGLQSCPSLELTSPLQVTQVKIFYFPGIDTR